MVTIIQIGTFSNPDNVAKHCRRHIYTEPIQLTIEHTYYYYNASNDTLRISVTTGAY